MSDPFGDFVKKQQSSYTPAAPVSQPQSTKSNPTPAATSSPFKNLPPSSYNPPASSQPQSTRTNPTPAATPSHSSGGGGGGGSPSPSIPSATPAVGQTIVTSNKTISRPQEGVVRITYGNDATVAPSLRGKTVTYVDAGQGQGEYRIEGAGQTYYDSQRKIAIVNGQPMSVDLEHVQSQQATASASATSGQSQSYVYDTTITGEPGKVQDIERWGRMQGIKVLRTSTPQEAQQGIYKLQIVSQKPLQNEIGQWLPGVFPMTTRTDEQIKQERMGIQAAVATDIAMKNAGPLEMAGFALKTTLSPRGIEYMGATTLEALGQKPPRPSKDIVKEVHAEILTTNPNGVDFETAYHQSMAGMESSGSPMPSLQMAITGGAVLGVAGGAGLLSSTAGKTALYGATALFAGQEALNVGTMAYEGRTSEAIGEIETLGIGIAGGALAYKSAASYMQNRVPKVMTVDFSKTRGISAGIQTSERLYSTGAFEVTEGKLVGLKGTTRKMIDVNEGTGTAIIDIPGQKVGGQKIKPQEITRFIEDAGSKQIGTNKVYQSVANSAKVEINGQQVKVVGPDKEIVSLRENYRVTKSTPQGDQVIIRQLEGVGESTKAGKYGLAVVKNGPDAYVVQESVLSDKMFSKIDWVDVTKIKNVDVGGTAKPEPYVRGRPSGTSGGSSGSSVKVADISGATKVADISTKEFSPAVPAGISKVSVEQNVKARIIPMPATSQASMKGRTSVDTAMKSIQTPAIMRKSSEGQKGRSISAVASAVTVRTISPQIERYMNAVTTGTMSTQVTGQRQVQVMDTINPTATRTAMQPVFVPIDVMPSTPVNPNIAIPGMPLFLTMGPSRNKKKNYGLGVIRNPVPDINKLI
jgi:hypothetical protein